MAKSDAISLLKKDHARLKALFAEMEGTTERAAKGREKLLEEIVDLLEAHTQVEEVFFYPAFREVSTEKEDVKLYFEALEEHHVVDLVIPDILGCDADTSEFAAKCKVLKELVEHHAKEEESDMFPRARKLLGTERLQILGEQMTMLRDERLAG